MKWLERLREKRRDNAFGEQLPEGLVGKYVFIEGLFGWRQVFTYSADRRHVLVLGQGRREDSFWVAGNRLRRHHETGAIRMVEPLFKLPSVDDFFDRVS